FYRFVNGGSEEVFIGSADLMNRNLDRRVEIIFPVESISLRERIVREALELPLLDNVKMRWLQSDGSYVRPRRSEEKAFNVQEYLLESAGKDEPV
ncbi:MAG: hypothetical protein RIR52_1717, partial [Acidobacteriota bacterium]